MYGKKKGKTARILGLWDENINPLNLGGFLIFLEELAIQRLLHKIPISDVFVLKQKDDKKISAQQQVLTSSLLSLAESMKGVVHEYEVNSYKEVARALPDGSSIIWPERGESKQKKHTFDSTLYIQKFYHKTKHIPYLLCKPHILAWVDAFIKNNVLPRKPIVVHLKNNQKDRLSNADFGDWFAFMSFAVKKYDVSFILIGNESIPAKIAKLPQVYLARKFGSTLFYDLGLITRAFLFMGMASGPCNMAIFSPVPYLIFKDPDHHSEEMEKELGDRDYFPFATSYQKLLRVNQSAHMLKTEFGKFYRARHKHALHGIIV